MSIQSRMRALTVCVGAGLLAVSAAHQVVAKDIPVKAPVAADANDNRKPAGKLSNGILTVHLEARVTMFYPEGLSDFYLMPGETYDVEVMRTKPQDLTLEVTTLPRGAPIITKIPVHIR